VSLFHPFKPAVQKEVKKVRKHILLTHSEAQWVDEQAEVECTSVNSIFRKSLKFYREHTESTQ